MFDGSIERRQWEARGRPRSERAADARARTLGHLGRFGRFGLFGLFANSSRTLRTLATGCERPLENRPRLAQTSASALLALPTRGRNNEPQATNGSRSSVRLARSSNLRRLVRPLKGCSLAAATPFATLACGSRRSPLIASADLGWLLLWLVGGRAQLRKLAQLFRSPSRMHCNALKNTCASMIISRR